MTLLAFLSLTTPLLLGGLALLALPIAAHLFRRQSRRTVVFPSISLLVQTLARHSRLHRLKRWLLLSLRLLAVICIVLAFTRPVWLDTTQGAGLSDEAGTAIVLLIDASASSGQTTNGVVRLEELKAAAGRMLDELTPGRDQAAVIVADAAPHSLFPRLSGNLGGLRDDLSQLRPSHERADLASAFGLAGKLLAAHSGAKRLVVLSDLQRDNWSDFLGAARPGDALPSDAVVTVLAPGDAASPNVALSKPAHFPSRPIAGEPVELSVHVSNHSDSPVQARIARERLGGDGASSREEQTVSLEPREQRDVLFRLEGFDGEREFVRFELPSEDALAIDNEAWLVVESSARLPVTVLSDDNPDLPGTAAYYLLRAFTPDPEAGGRFRAQRQASRGLTAGSLDETPLVAAGYLAALTPEAAAALVDFVRDGGSLMLFCGDGPVRENLDALSEAAGERFLPWAPGPRRTSISRRDPARIQSGRWQSRWLRQFDAQSQLAIESIQFDRVWTAGALAPEAEVLLSFENDQPALAVQPFGRGQVILAAFSPEATTSDLARHGAFVALVQMLAQAALPDDPAQLQPTVGETLTFDGLPAEFAASDLSAVGPDGAPRPVSINASAAEPTALLPASNQPGFYRLLAGDRLIDAAAVNLDPRESDLRALAAADVAARLKASGTPAGHGDTHDPSAAALHGRPLWGSLFTAALILIGAELLLLGIWRR